MTDRDYEKAGLAQNVCPPLKRIYTLNTSQSNPLTQTPTLPPRTHTHALTLPTRTYLVLHTCSHGHTAHLYAADTNVFRSVHPVPCPDTVSTVFEILQFLQSVSTH